MTPPIIDNHASGARLKHVAVGVLIVVVWAVGAWYSWSRTQDVRPDKTLLPDLEAYETVLPMIEDLKELSILIERPPRQQRKLRRRTFGQAQRAQYVLAPIVVYRMTSPRVAALHVRTRTRKSDVAVLHYHVTDEHDEEVRALFADMARNKSIQYSHRRISENLTLFRFGGAP